jgi:ATP-dependent HslUV protease, peptidase subunit HslV
MAEDRFPGWHGTTILAVRRGGEVVVAGDGQVSLGQTVIKGTARKVRRLSPGGMDVVCGLPDRPPTPSPCWSGWRRSWRPRPGSLARACVDLAKDWRMDKYLRNLEAMLIVTDGTDLSSSPARATCWSRSMTWPPSGLAATLRWRRRGG